MAQAPEVGASGNDDTSGDQPPPTLVPVTLSLPEAEPSGDRHQDRNSPCPGGI